MYSFYEVSIESMVNKIIDELKGLKTNYIMKFTNYLCTNKKERNWLTS